MEWYQNMFGFETEVRFDRPDLQLKGAIMRLHGYGLELLQSYEAQPLPEHSRELTTDLQVVGAKHLALVVDDVYESRRELEGKKVEFDTDVVEGKTARYFFAKDPDGILVEVKQALGGK
jgi:catechol 2,3-dioxygenase-like lactoylglutathione lyase family enzyme